MLYFMCMCESKPFVVLACAGAVGDGNRPVELLSVKTCSVGSSPLKCDLSAQQTLVTVLIWRRPALIVRLGTWHSWKEKRRQATDIWHWLGTLMLMLAVVHLSISNPFLSPLSLQRMLKWWNTRSWSFNQNFHSLKIPKKTCISLLYQPTYN